MAKKPQPTPPIGDVDALLAQQQAIAEQIAVARKPILNTVRNLMQSIDIAEFIAAKQDADKLAPVVGEVIGHVLTCVTALEQRINDLDPPVTLPPESAE